MAEDIIANRSCEQRPNVPAIEQHSQTRKTEAEDIVTREGQHLLRNTNGANESSDRTAGRRGGHETISVPKALAPYITMDDTGILLNSRQDGELAVALLTLPENRYHSWHSMFPAGLNKALESRFKKTRRLLFLVDGMPANAPAYICDEKATAHVFFSGYGYPIPCGEWIGEPPETLPIIDYADIERLMGSGAGKATENPTAGTKQSPEGETTKAPQPAVNDPVHEPKPEPAEKLPKEVPAAGEVLTSPKLAGTDTTQNENFLMYAGGIGPAPISEGEREKENKKEVELTIGGAAMKEIARTSQDIKARCAEWWSSADTLEKITDFIQESHYGDRTAIKIVLLATMQHRIQTIEEITYLSINAGSGGGKSDLVKSVASILPYGDMVIGGSSAKFLPRMGEKWDGKIIVYDDHKPDDQNIEYIKICNNCNGACTIRPTYDVLEKTTGGKFEPVSYPLPLRLCFIVARVDTSWGTDFEQVQNRMLPVYLDESKKQKRCTRKRREEKMTLEYQDYHSRAAEIMKKELWENLPGKIWVDVSKIKGHIECEDIENRMHGHLMNMIACNAVYRQWPGTESGWRKRNGKLKNEHEPIIYVEKEDAVPIIDLFNMMIRIAPKGDDPNAGGIVHKFTGYGKRIHDAILKKYRNKKHEWGSVRQMAKDLDIPNTTLLLGLYGRKESGGRGFAGIISQMPGLDSDKYTLTGNITDSHGDSSGTTRESRTYYPITWNPDEYWEQARPTITWVDQAESEGDYET